MPPPDRLRVGRVVLLRLNEGFYVDRRDQSNLVAEVADCPTLVVRAPTRFHSDDAARLFSQEGENLLARKLLPESDAAAGAGAMDLKGPRCKVETDDANLIRVPSPFVTMCNSSPWHIAMPSGGGIHSIKKTDPRGRHFGKNEYFQSARKPHIMGLSEFFTDDLLKRN